MSPRVEAPADDKPRAYLDHPIGLSFRYYDVGGNHCLTRSERKEVPQVLDCFRKLTTMTWYQVMQSGRSGAGKTGLNYELIPWKQLTRLKKPQTLSEDITQVSSVRAGDKYRIFGFQLEGKWHVLWCVRDHKF